MLEGQINIGKSLAKLLEATSTTQPTESCVYMHVYDYVVRCLQVL
ncbi:hypothetical protein PC121_g18139 [Phytophthora cactorum]|nr:hypothetical protein PC121_g18139 [Phytophthora cactorum]